MNFTNTLLKVEHNTENNIFHFIVQTDHYDKEDIDGTDGIKSYFMKLFEYFEQGENKDSDNPIYYGFVFDISVLSSYNMFKFSKDLKTFFNQYTDTLHKYVGCSAIIVHSTFIRVILAPIIKLINKGRSLTFTRDVDNAFDAIEAQLLKLNHQDVANMALHSKQYCRLP